MNDKVMKGTFPQTIIDISTSLINGLISGVS